MSDSTPPKQEVFTAITLPCGIQGVVYEGYGRHYFSAMKNAKGDNSIVIKYLILELLEIKGKLITEEQLDSLHIRDINYIGSVFGVMMSNGIPGLPGL